MSLAKEIWHGLVKEIFEGSLLLHNQIFLVQYFPDNAFV